MVRQLTVYIWLGMTKEEFEKKADGKHCVKCGKPTEGMHNLCKGHHIAFHRWEKTMLGMLE